MSASRRWFLPFRAWSLASKLSGIVMFTTLVGVVLCYLTFAIIGYQATLRDARGQITSLARVIAASTGAAVTLQDVDAAHDAFATLHDKPEIVAASVVLRSGEALAHYERRAVQPESVSNVIDPLLAGLRIGASEPVRVSGEIVGNLMLTADLSSVWRGLVTKLALSAIAVGGVLVLVALPLSRRWQRLISAPVIDLSSTARSITREGDYAIRAGRHGEDEVGTLIECFKAMLDRIQARDADIERVIVLSSDGDNPGSAASSGLTIDAWLRKPVRRQALLRCLVPSSPRGGKSSAPAPRTHRSPAWAPTSCWSRTTP